MFSRRYGDILWKSFQHFPVKLYIILALNADVHILCCLKTEVLTERDQNIMVVHPPERRKKRASFRAPVLHLVSEPYFEIAWVPDPVGCFLRGQRFKRKYAE